MTKQQVRSVVKMTKQQERDIAALYIGRGTTLS
jgi:hypothetical protein